MTRLLRSLAEARYSRTDIELIISIDKAENNQDVLHVAEEFEWVNGTKKIVYQEENLGLRKHILKCGSLSLEYGAVIVLEDDLFVSPNFYTFTEQALHFSAKQESIGGVSLYNHQLNVHTRDNFMALEDGYDNWYFQFASSWGQAWTKEQWEGFMAWYDKNPDIGNNNNVPAYVRSWSPKSWLKYNIAYLIERDLYFLYPKVAVATNFSDAGTHVGNDSTIYQVPLDYSNKQEYHFSIPEESLAVYDGFYENKTLYKGLGLSEEEVCIDLFGYKSSVTKKYLLSSKILNYRIEKSFGRSLKPHEDNIFQQISGNDFFLYNTTKKEENPNTPDWERKFIYNYKRVGYKSAKKLFIKQTLEKFRSLRKKIIGK